MPLPRRTSAAVLVLGSLFASSLQATAQSNCRYDTITVTGDKKKDIDDATKSAMDAAKAEIRKRYGKEWGLGPRRNAKFTCEKWLGGAAARIGWTCTLATAACKGAAQ